MPFWLHFCSTFGLRSLLDTHLYLKRGCSRKPLKTIEKSIFLTPRRLGNRPKIAPRRLQEVTVSLLNFHLFFYRFLLRFGSQNASLWAPCLLPKPLQKIMFKKIKCPKSRPKTTQFRPKTAQDRPKKLQEALRGSQEASKRLPRSSKSTPKRLQKHPRQPRRMP